MIKIQEYVDIKEYCTFKIGGEFRYFAEIINKYDLICAINFAKEKNIPVFAFGWGSNIVFRDGLLDILALRISIKGFEVINEDDKYVIVEIGAGENLDEVVKKTIEMKFSGFESLSGVPGTVGAMPIQNVGCYGRESSEIIQEVRSFDIKNNIFKEISNKECKFSYRDSIFKKEARGRYIVTSVIFRLEKNERPGIPDYLDVKRAFERKKNNNPTTQEIREVILNIRRGKFPDPQKIPNVGSFFKIAFITPEIAEKIRNEYSDARLFPINENTVKVPPGWLVEKAGFKGKPIGKTGKIFSHDMHALILKNTGGATFEDLIDARDEIIKSVKEKFGITLEQEPEII